jgi:hypothetical protein
MANFRKHISWGVFIGIATIIAGLLFSIISGVELIFWVFLAVLIGSFLPDLDLDEGVPFQILFGLLGAGLAGAVFFNAYEGGARSAKSLIILPIIVFLVVRFVAGYVFERFTDHRGIFHSIPAVVLSGLSMVWILGFLDISGQERLIIASAISLGYLGHLVLDEIYSSMNLHGHSLLPKQSLGSALKLYSSSTAATLFVYILIFVLVRTLPEIRHFFN